MGNTFSRSKEAPSEQSSQVADHANESDLAADADGKIAVQESKLVASTGIPQVNTLASVSNDTDLPAGLAPDLQFIIEAGLHNEVEDAAAKGMSDDPGQQGSIQDAVNDLKAKYNIGQPVIEGEIERIRREIDLKTKLIQMKEAQKLQRIAKQVQMQVAESHATSNNNNTGAMNGAATELFKVDVKGKGRASSPVAPEAGDESDSSSDGDDASSDEDSSDSGNSSSSSSGSSIPTRTSKPNANRKGGVKQAVSDDDDILGSDDDDDGPAKKLKPEEIAMAAAAFASQHEIINPQVPPPPVERLPEHVPLRSIGQIDHIIGTVIVVRADINTQESLQGQILDEGSLLCLEDRRVLGAIFETFGSVQSPFYSIRLPPGHPLVDKEQITEEAKILGCATSGMQVFYSPSPDFSGLLFTRDIRDKQGKASDASNLYDEEVGGNEIEFSDDEEEAEYRRGLKEKKKERWAERQTVDANQREAEFAFDDEFDDTASIRSFANRSIGTIDGEDEEGAIAEHDEKRKRRLSNATETSNTPAYNKQARHDGGQSGRGRGTHDRGRGGNRGRGNYDNHATASRGSRGGRGGRGSGRDNQSASRGRERGRGHDSRGSGPSRSTWERHSHTSSQSHALPPRPAYQHPDALPYDDAPLPYAASRSVSPVRPQQQQQQHQQHALPMRPMSRTEQYDPAGPRSPVPVGLPSNTPWSSPASNQPSVPSQHQQSYTMPINTYPQFNGHQEYNPATPHPLYNQGSNHVTQPQYTPTTFPHVNYVPGYSNVNSQGFPPQTQPPFGESRDYNRQR